MWVDTMKAKILLIGTGLGIDIFLSLLIPIRFFGFFSILLTFASTPKISLSRKKNRLN